MMQILKVATRKSPLALVQVDEIQQLLLTHGVSLSLDKVLLETRGDKDKITSLSSQPADNFFTDTIDQALIDGSADFAVHSAKDLPRGLTKGLVMAALTASVDETDAFVGKCAIEELPEGAAIGTSSLDRKKQLKALYPHVEAVDIRGTIEERIALIDRGDCSGVIVATAALKRLSLSGLIKNIMPWEAAPLQGQLAVIVREDKRELLDLFAAIDVRRRYGKVILVGAGPGDPELITLKGVKALEQAGCVFYDYLVDERLLVHAPSAEKIYAGKRKGCHTLPQQELSRMVRRKAQSGKNVVRLKGGDPLIFGRGAEEISYLKSFHIAVDVVPGLSSATSIPSRLGIPLTARDVSSSVAFLSGHGKDESVHNSSMLSIPRADTLVFLMGITKLPEIVSTLTGEGWGESVPVIVISNGTKPDEKIVCGTIKDIVEKVASVDIKPPALIVVGEIVKFYDPSRLAVKRILYTGTNPGAYGSLGEVLHWPMIEIEKRELTLEENKSLLARLYDYDIIMFTSRFGVEYFFSQWKPQSLDVGKLSKKIFVVIGKSTYNILSKYGFDAVVTATEETSEGLLEALKQNVSLKQKTILFPRSALPNPFLKQELERLGAQVDELVVYENKKPPQRMLPESTIDEVVFTSPSTVVNFLEEYKHIPTQWKIISKGPHTWEALRKAGYDSEVLMYESF